MYDSRHMYVLESSNGQSFRRAVTFSFCFKILQTDQFSQLLFSSWMALGWEWEIQERKNEIVELMLKNITLTLSAYCISKYANAMKSCVSEHQRFKKKNNPKLRILMVLKRRRASLVKNCNERVYKPWGFFKHKWAIHWLWSLNSHHISRLFQGHPLWVEAYRQVSCQDRWW